MQYQYQYHINIIFPIHTLHHIHSKWGVFLQLLRYMYVLHRILHSTDRSTPHLLVHSKLMHQINKTTYYPCCIHQPQLSKDHFECLAHPHLIISLALLNLHHTIHSPTHPIPQPNQCAAVRYLIV